MEEVKGNLADDQQDCTCSESNDSTISNAMPALSVPVKKFESSENPSNQVDMDKGDCKITIEVNNDQLLLDSNVSTTDLVKEKASSTHELTDDKSKESIPSDQESAIPHSSIPMEVLDVTTSKNTQKLTPGVTEDQSDLETNNKVTEPEEMQTIEIDSEHSTDFIKKKNLKNLSNQHSSSGDLYYIDVNTSLSAIAFDYESSGSSDSDYEDEIATKITDDQKYRSQNEIIITSDKSSDSESDSSSSDSDSDSDSSSSESENDDDDGTDDDEKNNRPKKKGNQKPMKPKGEFDNLPPIEDLKISVPEVLCDPLGEVAWMVEQMVVVRPKPGKPTLNLDTVLFIDKGKRALGQIFDVFGQVSEPHYCVRFNSSEHIKESDIKVGMSVYYCPNTQYTSLVFLSELEKMKASDDVGDDEVPEFSDDEEEQAYLASMKNKSANGEKNKASGETANKRRRGNKSVWQTNHPWSTSNNTSQAASQSHPSQAAFYRTHHPWSRPRYQPQNSWSRYNPYPNNAAFGAQFPPNQPQWGNQAGWQNVNFSQASWAPPQYPVPQWNPMPPPHEFQQQPMQPMMTLPPPPPPPPRTLSLQHGPKEDDKKL